MGSQVCVLFSDVKQARKYAEEATHLPSVQCVELVRPMVRRFPREGRVTVEVIDYNKPR
jgi:hypothetical protein